MRLTTCSIFLSALILPVISATANALPPVAAQVQTQGPGNASSNPSVNVFLPPVQKKMAPRQPLMKSMIYSGSLRTNITRIARAHGWKRVVWNVPNDYRWLGDTQLRAHNLPGILGQLLQDYPLQAIFYRGNHVLEIVPRTLR